MQLEVDPVLSTKYPGLRASIFSIKGVVVKKRAPDLEELREAISREVRAKYTLENLKDVPAFRAYRDFFWRIGIDPTKIRPAAEALIRRILANKPIPNINTLVDSYNLASIRSDIALAAFDESRMKGTLRMRSANDHETFLGIGMEKPMNLNGGEVVVADAEKLIAVYPYRDEDSSRVTEASRNVTVMVCGCPGIEESALAQAEQAAAELILRFCGGKRE